MNNGYIKLLLKKILVSTIVVGIFFEVFLRAFITTPSNHIYDPVIGFRYQPHSVIFLGTEGYARNRLNSLGLNDQEFKYDPSLKHAILLGDSYTEARQVDREFNFSSLAEQSLQGWDVINSGRDGLHVLNTYHVAQRLQTGIKPDLLVLVMNNGDYIDDMSDKNIVIKSKNNEIQDVYLKAKDKEKLKQYFSYLIQNSALAVHIIRQLKPIIIKAFSMVQSVNIFNNKGNQQTTRLTDSVNRKVRPNKKAIFSAYLKKLQKIAPVAILYINQLEYKTVENVYPAEKPYRTSLIVNEIAKENDVLFINTADYLVNQYFATGSPPFGFHNKGLPGGHLNKNGHIAVSKALSDLIKRVEQEGVML